jgi:hypothetical protein
MINHRGVYKAGKWISLVLAPRGSWKTGISTIGDSIHEVIHDSNLAGQILAESQETGKHFLSEIKQHFEMNELLRYVYGEHVSSTGWTRTEITSAQRTNIQKEPTLEVLGVGGRLVGRRATIQWGDDVVSLINSATEMLRNKLMQWWMVTVEPMLNPGGEQRLRGTRYFTRDLYYSLIEMYGKDILLRIPSLERDDDGNERSFWPERFTLQSLLEKRQNDPNAFALSMENDVSLLMSSIILPGMLKLVKDSEIPPLDELRGYIGVDPARKADGPGSFFAVCVLAQSPRTGMIYVLHETRVKLATPDAMLFKVRDIYMHFRERGLPTWGINIEDNAFQGILVQAARADPIKYGILPWMPSSTYKDKESCFIAQARFINADLVRFAPNTYRLYEDVASFPDSKCKDSVDAFVRALELVSRVGLPAKNIHFDVYGAVEGVAKLVNF